MRENVIKSAARFLTSERSIVTQAYLWLAIPIMLFIGFWFRLSVALPMIALLVFSLWKVLRRDGGKIHQEGWSDVTNLRKDAWILLGVAAYVIISGIGGLVAQAPSDHAWRNAIFFDICRNSWPVAYDAPEGGMHLLCYYFAFWLPSAVVSKATGSILAGDLMQIVYATWGTWIALNLIFSSFKGKASWAVLAVFVLFNAWDVITAFFFSEKQFSIFENPWSAHLRGLSTTSDKFGACANSIMYNFLYNQAIPMWVGITLILHERKSPQRLMFAFGLLPAFAPTPSLALIPFMTVNLLSSFKKIWTPENITGFLVALLSTLFLLQNDAGEQFRPIGSFSYMLTRWGEAILYYGLSFIAFIPFIFNEIRRDFLYWSTFAMAIIMAGFEIGDTPDLAWRISVPVVFLTIIVLCRKAMTFKEMRKPLKWAFVCVMAIGSFSSVYNIAAIFHYECESAEGKRDRKLLWMMSHIHDKAYNQFYINFISENDSFYRRWLMPPVKCAEDNNLEQ